MTSAHKSLLTFVALTFALVGSSQAFAQNNTDSKVGKAYQKEFAFLEAEKRSLKERISQEEKTIGARVKKAEAEIRSLQSKVVGASTEAERIGEVLLNSENDFESLLEQTDILKDLIERAQTSFSSHNIDLPKADLENRESLLAQLGTAFEKSTPLLIKLGSVANDSASYFGENGNEIKGDVLRVGGVASFGMVNGSTGPLAPAGADKLKLWPTPDAPFNSQDLSKANTTLPLFIYKNLDKPMEPKTAKSIKDTIDTGGLIGWVIVGCGLLALLLILLRTFTLFRLKGSGGSLIEEVTNLVKRKDIKGALKLTKRTPTSMGRVMTAVLENNGKDRASMEDIVMESVLAEQPELSRFGSAILIIAAVSPLLGLLGTVTGMISTFDIITDFGTGNPKLLSGGISEALVTTELGLIVAIPSLLIGNLLSGWSDRIRDQVDQSALATVNAIFGVGMTPTPSELEPKA